MLIIALWDSYIIYPHFTDEETGTGSLSNWPNVTQLVKRKVGSPAV